MFPAFALNQAQWMIIQLSKAYHSVQSVVYA